MRTRFGLVGFAVALLMAPHAAANDEMRRSVCIFRADECRAGSLIQHTAAMRKAGVGTHEWPALMQGASEEAHEWIAQHCDFDKAIAISNLSAGTQYQVAASITVTCMKGAPREAD